MPLAGAYFTSTGTHTSLAALNASDPAFTFTLGNPTNGNPPEFTLLGVGANSTLFRHDLLLTNGAPPASEPVSEGVRVLRAVYGIDTNADGIPMPGVARRRRLGRRDADERQRARTSVWARSSRCASVWCCAWR